MIDLQTFEDNLDRWGGTLARWPTEARGDAETLLAASTPARALHASMVELERALALPGFPGLDRFAAVATQRPQEKPPMLRRTPPMVRRAGWGAAVAAALVLGIMVGDVTFVVHDDNPDQVLASALGPSVGTVDVD